MYGGEISNNIQEMLINKDSSSSILPEEMTSHLICDVKGIISLFISTLNMCGGKILQSIFITAFLKCLMIFLYKIIPLKWIPL